METSKNVCSVKAQLTIVTRWLKKFCPSCKNLDDQVSSVRPSKNSVAIFRAKEENPASST